jgi:hypothetical protein
VPGAPVNTESAKLVPLSSSVAGNPLAADASEDMSPAHAAARAQTVIFILIKNVHVFLRQFRPALPSLKSTMTSDPLTLKIQMNVVYFCAHTPLGAIFPGARACRALS